MGSPPRVRSRLVEVAPAEAATGITSACAEQTPPVGWRRWNVRDHLRVCGADLQFVPVQLTAMGSPPRVRSRLVFGGRLVTNHGITSACAEQTHPQQSAWPIGKDHLRVCGADVDRIITIPADRGSPPRVRSRRDGYRSIRARYKITSACAEQTGLPKTVSGRLGDHLRVCGAD